MFTHATPASPTLATTTSSAQAGVPSSPTTRPSRLRGLSYLRNYTHALHRDPRDTSSPTTSASGQNGAAAQARAAGATGVSASASTGASSAAQRRQSLSRTTSYPPSPGRGANTQRQSQAEGDISDFDARLREAFAQSERAPAQAPGPAAPMPFITGTPANPQWSGSRGNVHTNGIQSASAQPVGIPAFTAEARDAASLTSAPPLRAPLRETGSDAPLAVNRTNNSLVVINAPSPPPPADFRSTIRFSQHQDPRAPRPSLTFTPMGRTLPTGTEIIKVGRYSERETAPNQPANMSTAAPVGFKSKVVSRRHCEFWVEEGQWFIRDVKSSSGTFLNHVRLSPPNTESRPYPVKDGDIVQLGIDFKGGEEMIFRCVKIRVEVNRGWQAGLNSFNVSSHRMLKKMTKGGDSSSSNDCSICLSGVAPCQALFVAPCSHTWHYKCIRPVLDGPHFPHFTCPNCRAVADLDADVDEPTEGEWEELDLALEQSQANASGAAGTNGASVSAPAQTQTQAAAPAAPAAEEELAQPSTVGVAAITPPTTAPATSPLQPEGLIGAELMSSLDIATPPIATRPISSEQQQRLSERMYSRPNEFNVTAPSVSSNTALEIARVKASAAPPADALLASPIAIRDSRPGARGRGSPEQRSETSPIDNPMTPRNDAGPFVFDGRAGTASDENGHGNEAGW